MITVTRISPFSGKRTTRQIDASEEQMQAYQKGALIQRAFPNLSASDREFIMTGITAEEWKQYFGEEEEA